MGCAADGSYLTGLFARYVAPCPYIRHEKRAEGTAMTSRVDDSFGSVLRRRRKLLLCDFPFGLKPEVHLRAVSLTVLLPELISSLSDIVFQRLRERPLPHEFRLTIHLCLAAAIEGTNQAQWACRSHP